MRIRALTVSQWLGEWDTYQFRETARQRKPAPFFYLGSFPVRVLRRLSNIPRRGRPTDSGRQEAVGPRAEDIGIQRGFEEGRATDIRNFIKGGYPWATLRRSEQEKFPELQKPGWLPTALVVNIVTSTTERHGVTPDPRDLIQIHDAGVGSVELVLPEDADSANWRPQGLIYPLEVIDGQHRLLAFDEDESLDGQFELPVVLFHDLDISWQAYLFWTINISPKRIGPSLAYDLYPLLRTEDWLDPIPGPLAYRETRAQELTEALWSNPESPWFERIGMLGRERGKVTQAAFVRSLALSFIRRADPGGDRPGGLFGAPLTSDRVDVLPWSRAQQAAYLVFLWRELERAIQQLAPAWANDVREKTKKRDPDETGGRDPAFSGIYSLLSTDQGVRGFFQVCNDLSFKLARQFEFGAWVRDRQSEATDAEEVSQALAELQAHATLAPFVQELCNRIARFDWRSFVTPGLPEEIRNRQALYRAGSGYREVRRQLLLHIAHSDDGYLKDAAQEVVAALKFEDQDEIAT